MNIPIAPARTTKALKLFFALWPDDALRRELGRWAGLMHQTCPGRRMRTENLHITIAFLGQVDAARFDDIVAAARTVRPESLSLLLDRPGYWKHNKIAWLGASEVPPELGVMVAALRTALAQARVAFDPKPFVPHVTVVRNALPPREDWPTAPPVKWPLRGFSLISSERDESGPYYRVVAGPFEG